MKSIADNIELKIPFALINVNSIGISHIEVICITDNLEVRYTFNHFHGFENREEFFDRKPAFKYGLGKLPNSNANFPISYIKFEDFKGELSSYELSICNENTKLWRFLSLTNIIDLFSDAEPEREIKNLTDEIRVTSPNKA